MEGFDMGNVKMVVVLVVVAGWLGNAAAAIVFARDGNVFYQNGGKPVQMTDSGRDRAPVLHPKGEWVYFFRLGKPPAGDAITVPSEKPVLQEELWRIRTDGTRPAMLYRAKEDTSIGGDGPYAVARLDNLQFSPDGDKVYFHTFDWFMSWAIHVMKPDGTFEKMIGDGNDTRIILSTGGEGVDEYRGYIVTSRHRYFVFGGTYDWYYLCTPDMQKEIGPVGRDIMEVTRSCGLKYTDGSEKRLAIEQDSRSETDR